MDVIRAIVDARTSQNMTQKEFAERTGINQADISKLENGTRNPSVNLLKRLADGMGMAPKIDFIPFREDMLERDIEQEKLCWKKSYIDNILPDFIFDGVRLSISRSSTSCVGKKCNDSVLDAIDIFADDVVYYIINERSFLDRFYGGGS